MRSKFIVVAILVMSLSISGCTKLDMAPSGSDKVNEVSSENHSISNKDSLTTSKTSNSFSKNQGQENIAENKPSGTFSSDNIAGKIKDIFYAKNNNVIVYADNLYLYDTQNDDIASESENKYDIKKIIVTNGGYAAVAMKMAERQDGNGYLTSWLCVFYDEKLNVKSTINLNDITGDEHISFVAIAKDSGNIAFTSVKGLSVYNYLTEKSNQIISFSDTNKVKGLCFIEELFFIDENKLFFKGGSFSVPVKESDNSFPTYGTVNVDGSAFINKENNNYNVGEMLSVYDTFALIPEFFMKATGKVLKINTNTMEETIHTLSSKGEGKDGVFGSDNGKYFASASLKNGLVVRVYETKNGKLIKEEHITDDNEAYFYRAPYIRLLDNSKTCIVLLGKNQKDIKTKTVTFGF